MDDAATVNARIKVFEKQKSQHQAMDSVNQQEITGPSHVANVDQASFCHPINAEVKRQVSVRLNDAIATAGEETRMDDIRLVTDSVTPHKK